MAANEGIVFAVPKGRILAELTPILARVGIDPEPGFADEADRRLRYASIRPLGTAKTMPSLAVMGQESLFGRCRVSPGRVLDRAPKVRQAPRGVQPEVLGRPPLPAIDRNQGKP